MLRFLTIIYYRFRQLRRLSLSKLTQRDLTAELFQDYEVDLEELSINFADLKIVKNNAFKHTRYLKKLDLSENLIATIEPNAFEDVIISIVWIGNKFIFLSFRFFLCQC